MLNIIPIPAFKDNYIWLLHDQQHVVVVDPGDAAPVLAYLKLHQLKLAAILCTHHHNDHVGGVCKLVELYNVPVYGPQLENISCVSHMLGDGDVIEIQGYQSHSVLFLIPGFQLHHLRRAYD